MSSEKFKIEKRPSVHLELGNCVEFMKGLPDCSVDVVLTDPPYGYLKHKLDRPFDEPAYFDQVRRILKDDGFHVTFSRGTSFYGWNMQLAKRGFNFKEEVIWDKRQGSSPALRLMRVHETVSIYAKNGGVIRSSLIPYQEMREVDFEKVQDDFARIRSALGNSKKLADLKGFVDAFEATGKEPPRIYEETPYQGKYFVTLGDSMKKTPPRHISAIRPLFVGMKEKSIMSINRDNNAEHPTQKPVRLMERLLMLVSDQGMTVLDPFMGSGSTGLAAYIQGRNFMGCEILPEYFEVAHRRIEGLQTKASAELAWCV